MRLGHLLGRLQDTNSLRGGTATTNVIAAASFITKFGTINTDYAAGTALPKLMAKSNPFTIEQAWDGAQGGLYGSLAQLLKDTLGAMVNIDQTLPEDAAYNLPTALQYLIRQMIGSGGIGTPTSTFQSCTAAIGTQTNGTPAPAGNAVFVFSAKNVQGTALQLMFPETLNVVCTQDSQGGATKGQEAYAVVGEQSVLPTSYLYPQGSGALYRGNLVDGSVYGNPQGNVLVNSDFKINTTANVPDNWTITVGTAATDFFVDTTNAYTPGGGAFKILGTGGAVLDTITQAFNTASSATVGAGGTPYQLLPDTQYAINGWIKVSSTPAAGVFMVALVDGSNNIMNDDSGAANSKTFDLTAGGLNVSTTFVPINCVFRTPSNLTTQTAPFALRLSMSTAITSTKSLWGGRFSMSVMNPIYLGGPFVSGCSGNAAMIDGLVPDTWTFAVTNNYSTSGSGLFHQWMDRICGLRSFGLQLPVTGSPTISDALIL